MQAASVAKASGTVGGSDRYQLQAFTLKLKGTVQLAHAYLAEAYFAKGKIKYN